jgi:hypothetical protein
MEWQIPILPIQRKRQEADRVNARGSEGRPIVARVLFRFITLLLVEQGPGLAVLHGLALGLESSAVSALAVLHGWALRLESSAVSTMGSKYTQVPSGKSCKTRSPTTWKEVCPGKFRRLEMHFGKDTLGHSP